MEKWLRRWRGVFCGHANAAKAAADADFASGSGSGWSPIPGKCTDTIRDLRSARCARGKSKKPGRVTVLDDLKTNLECDAFSSADSSKVFNVTLVVLVTILIQVVL